MFSQKRKIVLANGIEIEAETFGSFVCLKCGKKLSARYQDSGYCAKCKPNLNVWMGDRDSIKKRVIIAIGIGGFPEEKS